MLLNIRLGVFTTFVGMTMKVTKLFLYLGDKTIKKYERLLRAQVYTFSGFVLRFFGVCVTLFYLKSLPSIPVK